VAARNSNIANLVEKHGRSASVTFIDEPEPEELFCPLISVDDHVLEPPTVFQGRMPAKFADLAPRVDYDDTEVPWWIVDGKRLPILFPNGAAGRVMGEWKGGSRCKYDEFRLSVSDPVARLKDMDLTGVWASLCFGSTVWGFAGTRFSRIKDPELGYAALQAYNDWMIEDWCATDRRRFIPCQLPWLADPELAAAEVRRNAERGFRAVSFSENPEGLGFPSIYDEHWDPFLRACAETETVVNLHVGSSGRVANPSADSPPEVVAALFPISGIETVIDWIYARVPLRHPTIKIVLSEAGVSWVPMVTERLRRAHRFVPASEVWSADDPSPIDLLHRNFYYASVEDPAAFRILDLIGADHVMVETDFPHMDSTWPGCQSMIRGELEHLPPEEVRMICFENAARIYRHPLPPDDLIAQASFNAATV
jgi:predicted TIM-barrel fold metal-dependent hydrolase